MGDERDGADNLSEKVAPSVKSRSASWFARRLTNLQHGRCSSPTTRVSMYEIYCHPKHKEKVTIEMLKKGIIDEAVATKWGDASVTKAIIALLRAAYKDPNNKKFCLFSESCVPLSPSFTEVKEELCSHSKSYFDFMNLSDFRRRYSQLNQSPSAPAEVTTKTTIRYGSRKCISRSTRRGS